MSSSIQVELMPGSQARELVNPFYEAYGFSGRARDEDVFFLAFFQKSLVGAVRFCIEEKTPMLRTMMVAEHFRKQRVGTILLDFFSRYLDTNGVKNVFCLPYPHLEGFYGRIGFERVPFTAAPEFLQERAKGYSGRGEQNICMRRP